jgi:hypothetical protein
MKRMLLAAALVGLTVGTLALGGFPSGRGLPAASPDSPTAVSQPGSPVALPARATSTPSGGTPWVVPTAPLTPRGTSPFVFPTFPPTISATPSRDCTAVFPLDSVEAIQFGTTTIPQLEAAFGHAAYVGGRPTRFRFEDHGCVLRVTIGFQEALEAELANYGTLGLLIDRYGPPAAVGISQGNLTLLFVGNAVLLYPEQGIVAIFDVEPDALTLDTPVSALNFRPPYEVSQQIRRLNLRPVEWQPPLR